MRFLNFLVFMTYIVPGSFLPNVVHPTSEEYRPPKRVDIKLISLAGGVLKEVGPVQFTNKPPELYPVRKSDSWHPMSSNFVGAAVFLTQQKCEDYVSNQFKQRKPPQSMSESFRQIESTIFWCKSNMDHISTKAYINSGDRYSFEYNKEIRYFWENEEERLFDYFRLSKKEQRKALEDELQYIVLPAEKKQVRNIPDHFIIALLSDISCALTHHNNKLAQTLIQEIVPKILCHFPASEVLYNSELSSEERLTRFVESLSVHFCWIPVILLGLATQDNGFAHGCNYIYPFDTLEECSRKKYIDLLKQVQKRAQHNDRACRNLWELLECKGTVSELQRCRILPYDNALNAKRQPLRVLHKVL